MDARADMVVVDYHSSFGRFWSGVSGVDMRCQMQEDSSCCSEDIKLLTTESCALHDQNFDFIESLTDTLNRVPEGVRWLPIN